MWTFGTVLFIAITATILVGCVSVILFCDNPKIAGIIALVVLIGTTAVLSAEHLTPADTWQETEYIIGMRTEVTGRSSTTHYYITTDKNDIEYEVCGKTYGKYEKGDAIIVNYSANTGFISHHTYTNSNID